MAATTKTELFHEFKGQITSIVVENFIDIAGDESNITALMEAVVASYVRDNEIIIADMTDAKLADLTNQIYSQYGTFLTLRATATDDMDSYRSFVEASVEYQFSENIELVSSTTAENWYKYLSPWWSWDAWRNFSVTQLGIKELEEQAGHLVDAWDRASGAGWWWPHNDFCVVVERPTSIEREQISDNEWTSHQLHCENGPSMSWEDNWNLYHWHGTQIPEWVINDLTIENITAEKNTEVRRCAIERYGWDNYITHLGSAPIDVADDPGNPGYVLRLYEVPDGLYPDAVRLLIMENASRDRDGSRRTFAETVPVTILTAIEAAAWQFDVDVEVYKTLARAT